MHIFNTGFDNAVDGNDAKKLTNFHENFGVLQQGEVLSVEERMPVDAGDSIQYNIGKLKVKQYRMELVAQNMDHPNLQGLLMDKYTGTQTLLSLNGTNSYDFAITADSGSFAASRFKVVFKSIGTLPVQFLHVQAAQQGKDILVGWEVSGQTLVDHYELEKSLDGRRFNRVASQSVLGNPSAMYAYQWLDQHAVSGDNYYRVKTVDLSGNISYSAIVNVKTGVKTPGVDVVPNPVRNKAMHVVLNDLDAGNYRLQLIDEHGAIVLEKGISYTTGYVNELVILPMGIACGAYRLKCIYPNGQFTVKSLLITE